MNIQESVTSSFHSRPQEPAVLPPGASEQQAGSTSNGSRETTRALYSPRRSAQQVALQAQGNPRPQPVHLARSALVVNLEASDLSRALAFLVAEVNLSGATRLPEAPDFSQLSAVDISRFVAHRGNGEALTALIQNAESEQAAIPGLYRALGASGQAAIPGLHRALGASGPRAGGALAALQSASNLKTVVAAWYGKAHRPLPPDAEEFWSKIQQDKPDLASAFSLQLDRMRETAHYRRNRRDITQRIVRALDTLKNSPDALESCMLHAVAATTSCRDGTALAFVSIEETILKNQTSQGSDAPRQLVKLAKGLFRSHRLDQLANELADTLGGVDRVEIILRVRVELSAKLDLPSKIKSMIYANCARSVTHADIQRIKQQVREDQEGDGFYEFISTIPFWTAYLNEHHGERLTAAQELIGRQKDDLHGQLAELLENPELNDQVKNTRSREVAEEFNRIEKRGLCDLSKSIIASLGGHAVSRIWSRIAFLNRASPAGSAHR
jgi:hypothetical protein